MMKATQESVTGTSVLWNIKRCPVPPGFDARRVGPCIKRFLEKLGHSGPLTITAIGALADVPDEVLRAVSSTGIVLHITPFGDSVLSWSYLNRPPANLMVITNPTDCDCCLDLHMLHQTGYNIIKPYPFGPTSECLWKNFLLAESRALEEEDKCIEEEDKCIETGESTWVCSVCDDLTRQGFENFKTHLSSEEHAQEKLGFSAHEEEDEEDVLPPLPWEWIPRQYSLTPSECPLAYATTMVMHQPTPKTWECFPTHQHMSATPSECPHGYATTMLMIQPKCFATHPHMFATPSECHHGYATTMGMIQPTCFPLHPHVFATPSECHHGYATTMGMIQPTCFPPHPHVFATPSESHGKNEPEASSNI